MLQALSDYFADWTTLDFVVFPLCIIGSALAIRIIYKSTYPWGFWGAMAGIAAGTLHSCSHGC